MDYAQLLVFLTLISALVLFMWGRLRHDVVAAICLLFLVVVGQIPAAEAFIGFGHPAVITVAMVLIVSKSLEKSGLIDVVGKQMLKAGNSKFLQILLFTMLVTVASAFMNNVGALAILMPVAIHVARSTGHSPSLILMPIAFGSLLGGMTTMIGTPPNIIIATMRAEEMGEPFGMFDFSPVGVFVALIGVAFITLIGWRFIPIREANTSEKERFKIDEYITEVILTEESILIGEKVAEVNKISKSAASLLGIIRSHRQIHAPGPQEIFREGDILILEADSDELKAFVENSKSKLVGDEELEKDVDVSDEITMIEVVVMADSPLLDQTASNTRMRSRYGVNLLAVARKDKKIHRRIDHVRFQTGDVLLLQGKKDQLNVTISDMGFLPLADRGFTIGEPRRILLSMGIFVSSILLVVGGLLEVQVAFTIAALLMVITNVLPVKEIYTSIDWPVIVLLGAMIPVGTALETSGGADLIADQILGLGGNLPVWIILAIVLVVTMCLSDLINNAATAVLMVPIGITLAKSMEVSADPFLMAIAVGASCAFLTPIGHQSNTLVMGPGGYKFSDYWRMGLPLQIIIIVISVPTILYFWPH